MDEEILDVLPALSSAPEETTIDLSPIVDALGVLQSVDGMLLFMLAGLLGAVCALAFFGEMRK